MGTEIFATFGPACQEKQILKEMIHVGMTGMRLNLSHTMLLDSKDKIEAYQNVAKETGIKPQILIDMQGPELRIGKIEKVFPSVEDIFLDEGRNYHQDEIYLQEGAWIGFCDEKNYLQKIRNNKVEKFSEKRNESSSDFKCTSHIETQLEYMDEESTILDDSMFGTYFEWIPVPKNVISTAEVGDEILLDDGKLLVKVEETDGQTLYAKVLRGGRLQGRKSIKIIGKNVKMPPLTEHDIQNIKLAKDYGITALMQPFVLCGEDLRYVRATLKEHGAEHIQIYAKIENLEGVKHIEGILPEADVIIIARGDLGNDMPLWELPRIQKQIETACKKAGKPYIVVTQMLASMEQHPVPTRAEVSDIFHAVFHGAWGVMVTGETAIGKYPVEAVRYLVNTAREAESYRFILEGDCDFHQDKSNKLSSDRGGNFN